MPRKEIGTSWNRDSRNSMNDNFKELYDVQNRAIKEATQSVIDYSKLTWQEPVETYNDIVETYPSPEVGFAVMTRDTGKVYRYDVASFWKEIQDIDPTVINEVDARLTAQLAQSVHKLTTKINLVPLFTDDEWNLHSNATVDSPTKITLNADANWQNSVFKFNVTNGTILTLTSVTNGRVEIRRPNNDLIGVAPLTFTATSDEILELRLTNSTTGTFTFENIMLTRGSEEVPFEKSNKNNFESVNERLFAPRVNLDNFPRLAPEISDSGRLQRAVDYAYTLKNSLIRRSTNSRYDSVGGIVIDLNGKVLKTTSTLIISNIADLTLQNGSLYYDGTVDQPMIRVGDGLSENIHFRNLSLECNRKASGIYMSRYIRCTIDTCYVHAFTQYGVWFKGGGNHESIITRSTLAEYIYGDEGNDVPSNRTGVGIKNDANDSMIFNNIVIHCRIGIETLYGGAQINGNHIYQGSTEGVSPALVLGVNCASTEICNNYFDSGTVIIKNLANGAVLDNNTFIYDSENHGLDLFAPIIFAPHLAGTYARGFSICNNHFTDIGTISHKIIEVDKTNGDIARVYDTYIKDNVTPDTHVGIVSSHPRKTIYEPSVEGIWTVDFADEIPFGKPQLTFPTLNVFSEGTESNVSINVADVKGTSVKVQHSKFVSYTGNGTKANYKIAFNWINFSLLKATVDGVNASWTMDWNNNEVVFDTPPPDGSKVKIFINITGYLTVDADINYQGFNINL